MAGGGGRMSGIQPGVDKGEPDPRSVQKIVDDYIKEKDEKKKKDEEAAKKKQDTEGFKVGDDTKLNASNE